MDKFLKKLWWNVRLWTYRKLHASLIAQYTEPENFHSLIVDRAVAFINDSANAQTSKIEEPQNLFVGVIAEDWNARINEKISVLEENERNK